MAKKQTRIGVPVIVWVDPEVRTALKVHAIKTNRTMSKLLRDTFVDICGCAEKADAEADADDGVSNAGA